jgi:hypothetical protein
LRPTCDLVHALKCSFEPSYVTLVDSARPIEFVPLFGAADPVLACSLPLPNRLGLGYVFGPHGSRGLLGGASYLQIIGDDAIGFKGSQAGFRES